MAKRIGVFVLLGAFLLCLFLPVSAATYPFTSVKSALDYSRSGSQGFDCFAFFGVDHLNPLTIDLASDLVTVPMPSSFDSSDAAANMSSAFARFYGETSSSVSSASDEILYNFSLPRPYGTAYNSAVDLEFFICLPDSSYFTWTGVAMPSDFSVTWPTSVYVGSVLCTLQSYYDLPDGLHMYRYSIHVPAATVPGQLTVSAEVQNGDSVSGSVTKFHPEIYVSDIVVSGYIDHGGSGGAYDGDLNDYHNTIDDILEGSNFHNLGSFVPDVEDALDGLHSGFVVWNRLLAGIIRLPGVSVFVYVAVWLGVLGTLLGLRHTGIFGFGKTEAQSSTAVVPSNRRMIRYSDLVRNHKEVVRKR